jgi:biopolymer transport protein ExbD
MNLRPRRPEDPELNMTSLIDVVLLLVIFFMVSTTFVQEGRLRVQLPSTTAQPRAQDADPLVITITAEGAYRVGERPLANNARATLSAALAREAGARRDVPVAIRADARATHQAVVTAMDVAGKLGFAQVNIATVDDDSAGDDGAR